MNCQMSEWKHVPDQSLWKYTFTEVWCFVIIYAPCFEVNRQASHQYKLQTCHPYSNVPLWTVQGISSVSGRRCTVSVKERQLKTGRGAEDWLKEHHGKNCAILAMIWCFRPNPVPVSEHVYHTSATPSQTWSKARRLCTRPSNVTDLLDILWQTLQSKWKTSCRHLYVKRNSMALSWHLFAFPLTHFQICRRICIHINK